MDQTSLHKQTKAVKITVKGRVQGVGFRPFIFQLAQELNIFGTVQNNMDGVKIFAEGSKASVKSLTDAIRSKSPRLSRIDEVIVEENKAQGFSDFSIIESERTGKSSIVIPVDSAVCPECLQEMKDPENFRYHYPFINCTQCGPRYTIIDSLPYDRPYTTMRSFEMCDNCKEEYENPLNRRHHAQPIACESCGPKVVLSTIKEDKLAENEEAIVKAVELLKDGRILAVKGIGGYHLVCDAYNEEAVLSLRQRKNRPNRPLAVMAASVEIAKEICHVSSFEEEVLKSPEAPIVIMKKRKGSRLAEGLAPGMSTLGVMLPYAPLHHLFFDLGDVPVYVMTSANPSGLPMLYRDEEAFTYLKGIGDFILTGERLILHPVDDSVVQVLDGELSFIRRSRGFVPDPIVTDQPVHEVVALGPQQKNTFALGRHEQIFVGPHIGEMEHLEVIDHYEKEFAHLMKWMGIKTKAVAVDMHPGYATTEMGNQMEGRIIPVQHHHAHHVSCMEDNRLTEPVFGIILDGTGYGEDGHIWGFELLYGDAYRYERLAHLQYTHLPGSEKAVREPWRNATGMLIDYFGEKGIALAKQLFKDKDYEIEILANMVQREMNSPLAGTCGRLFDAVSAILGICEISTYDGEAAIKLSERTDFKAEAKPYPYRIDFTKDGLGTINFAPALLEIVEAHLKNVPVDSIIHRFHETIVSICVELVTTMCRKNPAFHREVVLSGGSLHNPYLRMNMVRRLRVEGFSVYTHKKVPCSDGGISLGQLVVAANRMVEGEKECV